MENNNRQGCRWTKPEDKLPEYLNKGFSKMSDYVPVRIYDDYEKRVIYSTARYCHDRKMWFDIMHNSENNCVINPIEWLYESIPCATSSENYWKQRCEAAEGVLHFCPLLFLSMSENVRFDKAYEIWKELKSKQQ